MNVYVVVHLTAPMVFDVDDSKSPPTTSYTRTIVLLKKLAAWVQKKKGRNVVTYIGKRRVLQNELKKEDPLKDPSEVLQDAVFLGDQLEEIRLENDISPEDTMILFSNSGGYLANTDVKAPCRTQLILMDNSVDDVTKAESSDLQNIVDASIETLVNKTRLKDFKTMQFCKAKNGEVLYRLIKDHFLEFTVRIFVGKLKQPVVLDPPCNIIPKGSLHVVGFLKSSSLMNMPVISKHIIHAPSLLTVSRKEFKEGEHKKKSKKRKKKHAGVVRVINDQKNKKKFLGLMYMLKENLATHDCVALARHQSGQHCAIYSIKEDKENAIHPEFGIALLDVLEQFKFDELVPLGRLGKLDEQNVTDLHVKTRKDLEIPSYNANVKCWTSSQGINVDFQKIFRIFRKIEKEKLENIYGEVNRFREYAILIGMFDFMKELAEVFRSQTATMGEVAQKHGKHIAKYLERDFENIGRYEPIPIFTEKEPEKEEPKKPHKEERRDKDERHFERHEKEHRHREDRRREDRYERRHR